MVTTNLTPHHDAKLVNIQYIIFTTYYIDLYRHDHHYPHLRWSIRLTIAMSGVPKRIDEARLELLKARRESEPVKITKMIQTN